jgi:hypothetical protein
LTLSACNDEMVPEPSGSGTVVLDIGGTVGAAVIYAPQRLGGSEIEIRPRDGEWKGQHTSVRERRLQAGARWAAVFASLPAGAYDARVRLGSGAVVHEFEVVGGEVSETTWPSY